MNRILLIAILCVTVISMCAGQTWISPMAIFGSGPEAWIVNELRAPRVVLALGIGAALGLSGAVLQGFTRNALADASVLGVSSAASLGAVTALFFSLHMSGFALPLAGMLGAGLGMALLLALLNRSQSTVAFLLVGVMLNIVAGALTSLVISLSPSPFAISEIITWLMGALTDRSWRDALYALPPIMIGCALLLRLGRDLDALALGENTARTLGLNPKRLRLIIIIGVGLSIGAAVSVCGVIGFVGLVVPHIVRHFVGARPSALLMPSMLGGALLLALADMAVRLIPTAAELKLGVVMALIGGPVFFVILRQMREARP
jgi:iron complex transport system permease protein